MRLGHWFKNAPQFWLNLQSHFDLVAAEQEAGDALRKLPTRAKLPAKRELPRLI
ncbi:MAG: hypothetical protein U5J99_12830 [Parvularculaceae bacterium]|nr:hypothetical protein [Parvularculaceae bacterium]